MSKVIQRKIYLLSHDLNASKSWNEDIRLEFTPDEMIVKSVQYVNDPKQYNTDYLTSDLVHWDPICLFSDYVALPHPNMHFQMGKQIKGPYNFRALANDGATSAATGILMILLEFVQYEKH